MLREHYCEHFGRPAKKMLGRIKGVLTNEKIRKDNNGIRSYYGRSTRWIIFRKNNRLK